MAGLERKGGREVETAGEGVEVIENRRAGGEGPWSTPVGVHAGDAVEEGGGWPREEWCGRRLERGSLYAHPKETDVGGTSVEVGGRAGMWE